MKRHERLSPPRPGQGELFYAAERYIERLNLTEEPVQPHERKVSHLLAANGMIGYAVLGSIYGRPLMRLFEERRTAVQEQSDEAMLMTEFICRDISPFTSIEALARHIVDSERPH